MLFRSVSQSRYRDRIGEIRDGTEAGRMSTAGFKKMFSPQGPMMVKLANGAIADVQGQEQGVAEGVTPASVSKVLRLIDRHHPEWFDNYGMGEVEDTVVDLADMGQFSGMSAADALELVGQELESLYGQQGVAEGLEEQVYKVVALDKSNALKKPTKLNVKASSIEDVFSRLAANDWYALSINGVEVVAGKRLKHGVYRDWETDRKSVV